MSEPIPACFELRVTRRDGRDITLWIATREEARLEAITYICMGAVRIEIEPLDEWPYDARKPLSVSPGAAEAYTATEPPTAEN